jgi:Ca2+-binding EF-hand superfamily protein
LNAVDTDKSGKIDLNEFKALIKMFLIEIEKELDKK